MEAIKAFERMFEKNPVFTIIVAGVVLSGIANILGSVTGARHWKNIAEQIAEIQEEE